MSFSTYKGLLIGVFLVFCAVGSVFGQINLHGTVYNMYRTKPLEAVSVITSSGKGTTTDSNGYYFIVVKPEDSISFSYLGRLTAKFPISAINTNNSFDIALHVDPTELKEVKVMPRSYHTDSIQNRQDYAKLFNYKKPGFKVSQGNGMGGGAGVDLDQLIEFFNFSEKRRNTATKARLIDEEHDKYVDHRFNRSMVLKITKLEGDKLDTFMVRYRPSYEFCVRATDYDLMEYVKLAFREDQKDRKDRP